MISNFQKISLYKNCEFDLKITVLSQLKNLNFHKNLTCTFLRSYPFLLENFEKFKTSKIYKPLTNFPLTHPPTL